MLQEKLGEAHGLAIAAAVTLDKVEGRLFDHGLRRALDTMRLEANETRARCLEAERSFGADTAAEILAHANAINEKASDLAGTWFKAGTGPLAAWSFLAMGEAAEVAVWAALASLAGRDEGGPVAGLASWALPVQERHLRIALEGAARLAETIDPAAPRWG
ncbi:MAG TPA: hypothetical protein VE753_05330 [Gaiellaceae bacterium]|nr:hypothetical protein [Gaiellaceae bacterium]